MKLFKITPESGDYDQFDGCVVVAESKEEIEKMINVDECGTRHIVFNNDETGEEEVWFNRGQGDLRIEEIGLDKSGLILASFNAG